MGTQNSAPTSQMIPGAQVLATDVYNAVDTTDNRQSPAGTTKKYTLAQLQTFISNTASGPLIYPVTLVSMNYAVIATDVIIAIGGSSSMPIITLPEDAQLGRVIFVNDQSGNAGTYTITIEVAGGGTIDGEAEYLINTNYGSVMLYTRNGTAWYTL